MLASIDWEYCSLDQRLLESLVSVTFAKTVRGQLGHKNVSLPVDLYRSNSLERQMTH